MVRSKAEDAGGLPPTILRRFPLSNEKNPRPSGILRL